MTPQRLGQHFLIDTSVVKMIVDAADMRHDDIVVEVGPGRGALTKDIVSQAGQFAGNVYVSGSIKPFFVLPTVCMRCRLCVCVCMCPAVIIRQNTYTGAMCNFGS